MEITPNEDGIEFRFDGIGELQAAALVVGAFGKIISGWKDIDPASTTDAVQVSIALDGVAKAFMGADAISSIRGTPPAGEIRHRISGTAGLVIDTALAAFTQRPDWFTDHLDEDQMTEAQMQFPPVAA